MSDGIKSLMGLHLSRADFILGPVTKFNRDVIRLYNSLKQFFQDSIPIIGINCHQQYDNTVNYVKWHLKKFFEMLNWKGYQQK